MRPLLQVNGPLGFLCDSAPTWLASSRTVVFNTACRPSSGMNWQEQVMSMNKDQVKGRVKEAKGKIKELAGKLVGNESLEAKGKVQKTLGKAQAKFGDVKQDVKDAAKAA
jgi:uncharacterized protein YjbJ (UPF0337 family)